MLVKLLTKVFGSRNERKVLALQKKVEAISCLEPEFTLLQDAQLAEMTEQLKERLANGETLESIIPESFALVREASKRTLGLRPFDVQLMGGLVLNERAIAEMRTGEGKTLTATLPAYLNALLGKGVHIVTVNEYLAQRDAMEHAPLFAALGMRVGVTLRHQTEAQKREAYAADITYGTNSEFGFDYLRDNMVSRFEHKVQRGLYYALIDEVDSILIDEARTPLIIAEPKDRQTQIYARLNDLALILTPQADEESETGDYFVNLKLKQVTLTERGMNQVEHWFEEKGLLNTSDDLYQPRGSLLMHCLHACLRAHTLYRRDVDYVVRNGAIILVDEHTGRTMPGRRCSDGLHQALEAKEHVEIHPESHTTASISYQNYFRLYTKLAGMTGTADTEACEFKEIYQLETIVIPTNQPMIRVDHDDSLYLSHAAKLSAVVTAIKNAVAVGQPVLVGTISIEKSEELSALLREQGIKHSVLNAKFHDREAEIIAEAGQPGTVTIATNMAGRGTDIVLGGCLKSELKKAAVMGPVTDDQKAQIIENWQRRHDEVVAAGGLLVIGTERHESRRIDNQLRGRSGRQGDPGASRFFVCLEDSLIKMFCSGYFADRLIKWQEDPFEPIDHPWITGTIANAQQQVESRHFDMRKHLLEYDDVANEHRKIVYRCRDALLKSEDLSEVICLAREEAVKTFLFNSVPGVVRQRILQTAALKALDKLWNEHLLHMEYLKTSTELYAYAERDPKKVYQREAFRQFTQLFDRFNECVTELLVEMLDSIRSTASLSAPVNEEPDDSDEAIDSIPEALNVDVSPLTDQNRVPAISRNALCPCGSNKRYKVCHGSVVNK